MRTFSKETAEAIMTNKIKTEELLERYAEYKEEVLLELETLKSKSGQNFIPKILEKYTDSAKLAMAKIEKSKFNATTVNAFLPEIIKSRFVLHLLQHYTKTGTKLLYYEKVLLQQLLFRRGFERKPVSIKLFAFVWFFIKNKKSLMPLLNDKGIYCFFSKELIIGLTEIIENKPCLEIAAGDGMLAVFLNIYGTACKATDDYSWQQYINYPDFVEKADAKSAIKKYRPEVVICSWPAPGNTFEKFVFDCDSVQTYIVIGSRNPRVTGNFELYRKVGGDNANGFTMELDEKLSGLVIPMSGDNGVLVFRRKNKTVD